MKNIINTSFGFDLSVSKSSKVPLLSLGNGEKMPVIGLGTYSLRGEKCVSSVLSAIRLGYRKFDTASFYGNEKELGEAVLMAIDEGLVRRKDLFITTKLYPNQFSNPEKHIEESLSRLDIGYVDLMLLHHPGPRDVSAYKMMEKYVKIGKIRSLGVSNFYIKEMSVFLPKVKIKPVLCQNEIHPYYQESDVVRFLHENNIAIEAWYPFGGRGFNAELMEDPVLVKIAEKHEKSLAQVILRWNLQNGITVIPGSDNLQHQKENIEIFDFDLTPEEMLQIKALDRGEKHDWY